MADSSSATETIFDTHPAPVGPSFYHRSEVQITRLCEGRDPGWIPGGGAMFAPIA
jgi:hypothetical protein